MIYDLFDFTKQTGIIKQTLITSYNISIKIVFMVVSLN